MKRTAKTLLACLLAAALLLTTGAAAFAKNGPYVSEDPEWELAFLALYEYDENEDPVTVTVGEGEDSYEEYKHLPLYVDGKVTNQPGAVYDKATNTLTLTDFNQGNYELFANLMGDDFTLTLHGRNRLSHIQVNGGGVMQPTWGGSLTINGDGELEVNPNRKFDEGILFFPQEEESVTLSFEGDARVRVEGKVTPIFAYSCVGAFTVKANGETVNMNKKNVEREVFKGVAGYWRESELNIPRATCDSDPDGVYGFWMFYEDSTLTTLVNVKIAKYYYLETYGCYVENHKWTEEHKTDMFGVNFKTVAEAEAAGYHPVLDGEGKQVWDHVKEFGNYSSFETLYQSEAGGTYVVVRDYDSGETPKDVAMSLTKLPEELGEDVYLFRPTSDPVDIDKLTEQTEIMVFDDMFDYTFAAPTYTYDGDGGEGPMFTLGDVDGDGKITASDARLALRRAVDLETWNEMAPQFLSADVDMDGKVTASDARKILRAAVDLEDPKDWGVPGQPQ
ncbi:MAG: dockerin type I repeat-containing protein [Clostridia bacterium]|nr:dockerin type I repeat-containing protein [Clostridia bacterium]